MLTGIDIAATDVYAVLRTRYYNIIYDLEIYLYIILQRRDGLIIECYYVYDYLFKRTTYSSAAAYMEYAGFR